MSRKTCFNDGKTRVSLGWVFPSENGSSSGLEDESDKVGNHESDGVCAGAETGEAFAVDSDDSS